MIELTNIKATDTVGQLRGQINRMQNDIMTYQPMIGHCVNLIGNLFSGENPVADLSGSKIKGTLFALIFPENNGCFVADIIGQIILRGNIIPIVQFDKLTIRIPAIKAPDSTTGSITTYNSFLSPSHLGITKKPSTTTEEYHIGFNSTISGSGDMRNPFIDAYISTNVDNPTNLLKISLIAPQPVATNSKTELILNF